MKYAELFAGAGGLSLGLDAAGFHPLAHAEIEPHARAVLRYRWPDTRLDGDVTQINGADYAGITLLSGGSPCQDLSVAGKRAGLTGSRSSLFHEQCRIWRESLAPYLLWENVGGALSSNKGHDFATVLSTIVGRDIVADGAIPADKHGKIRWLRAGRVAGPSAVAAYRVFDLQHFGPPQRRVRVFILAARTGELDPAEILAFGEGVCGHPSPRSQARENIAADARGGVEGGGVVGSLEARTKGGGSPGTDGAASGHIVADVAETLRSHPWPSSANIGATVLAFHQTQEPIHGEVSPSLGRSSIGMGVMAFGIARGAASEHSVIPSLMATKESRMSSTELTVLCTTGDVTHALTHEGADASEDGTGRGTPIVLPTLAMGAHTAKPGSNGQDALQYADALTRAQGRPRRLTPLECERIMSWPDQWTEVGVAENGRIYELSDTARYRLCGNGVGSVCAEWIGRRLMAAITEAAA